MGATLADDLAGGGARRALGRVTAVMLGMGRAIGETMAVMMVTGTPHGSPGARCALSPVRTMTATIAAEMGEVAQESTITPVRDRRDPLC